MQKKVKKPISLKIAIALIWFPFVVSIANYIYKDVFESGYGVSNLHAGIYLFINLLFILLILYLSAGNIWAKKTYFTIGVFGAVIGVPATLYSAFQDFALIDLLISILIHTANLISLYLLICPSSTEWYSAVNDTVERA